MSIITPAIGALYLIWQIHRRDLRGWQHYACLTSLIFLISILFLVASGKVESFNVAGNNVRMVDQKLEEVKTLTEQNKRIAITTARLVISSLSQTIVAESYNPIPVKQELSSLLREAGLSPSEIEGIVGKTNVWGFPTNSPDYSPK